MIPQARSTECSKSVAAIGRLDVAICHAGTARRQWDSEPDCRRRAEKAIPLGALQTPESVADAVILLCSEASDYMTGATLLVDGGCSLYLMD